MASKKEKVLNLFLAELERELDTIVEAAFQAKEAATGEESRAENKYDTRGLEASYLAGAQAKRAGELREFIDQLKRVPLKTYTASDPIEVTALVLVTSEEGAEKSFFIVPREGGARVEEQGQVYFVISPESPMGRALWQKRQGDSFEFTIKGEQSEYEITRVE